MADEIFPEALNGCENLEIFGDDSSKIKAFSFSVDGIITDIVFCSYEDKNLLVLTQYQKIGTLMLAAKGTARSLNGFENVFDIKTLSGVDNQEYHLVARYLAERLNITKPILFSISLKNHSLKTLKCIVKALKDNHILTF